MSVLKFLSLAVKVASFGLVLAPMSVAYAQDAAEGDVIKGKGAEVYLVVFHQKRHVVSPDVLTGCGLNFGMMKTLDDAIVTDIPTGAPLPSAEQCKAELARAKSGPKDNCEKVKFFEAALARYHTEYRKTDAKRWFSLKEPLKQKIVDAEAKKAEAQKGCSVGDNCAAAIASGAAAPAVCSGVCSKQNLKFAGNWSCDNAAAKACSAKGAGSCVCGCN
jgi:hypothetical protein